MLTKRDRCALDNGESRLVFSLTDKSKAFDCLHNPLFLNWLAPVPGIQIVERKVQIWWGASKSYVGKTKGKTKWDFFLLVNFSPRSTIWTPGTGYKLMRLYLTDRYHRVRFGDVISSWKEVGKGFLQGFSFGPPLWNVFQNDLTYKI